MELYYSTHLANYTHASWWDSTEQQIFPIQSEWRCCVACVYEWSRFPCIAVTANNNFRKSHAQHLMCRKMIRYVIWRISYTQNYNRGKIHYWCHHNYVLVFSVRGTWSTAVYAERPNFLEIFICSGVGKVVESDPFLREVEIYLGSSGSPELQRAP